MTLAGMLLAQDASVYALVVDAYTVVPALGVCVRERERERTHGEAGVVLVRVNSIGALV